TRAAHPVQPYPRQDVRTPLPIGDLASPNVPPREPFPRSGEPRIACDHASPSPRRLRRGRTARRAAQDGIGPLVTALGDKDPAVAAATASALAGSGPEAKAARPALLASLGDLRQQAGDRRLLVGRRLQHESLLKVDPDARHDAVLALPGVLK